MKTHTHTYVRGGPRGAGRGPHFAAAPRTTRRTTRLAAPTTGAFKHVRDKSLHVCIFVSSSFFPCSATH